MDVSEERRAAESGTVVRDAAERDEAERPDVEPHEDEVAPGDRRLLVAAAAGPLAWLAQLGAGFATVRWMCALDSRLPLAVATAAALAVAGWALVVCGRAAVSPAGGGGTPGASTAEGAPPALAGARRALAWSGAGLAAFFLLLIVATALPGAFLEPCR